MYLEEAQEHFKCIADNFEYSKKKAALLHLKQLIEKQHGKVEGEEIVFSRNSFSILIANIDRELYHSERNRKNKEVKFIFIVIVVAYLSMLIGSQWQFNSDMKKLEGSSRKTTHQIKRVEDSIRLKKNHVNLNNTAEENALPVVAEEAKLTNLGVFHITGYCACKKCTGKSPNDEGYGVTKSGTQVEEGVTIGVDPSVIPLGSKIKIEGFSETFIAQDTGKGIKGKEIDLYRSTHEAAKEVGNKYLTVELIE